LNWSHQVVFNCFLCWWDGTGLNRTELNYKSKALRNELALFVCSELASLLWNIYMALCHWQSYEYFCMETRKFNVVPQWTFFLIWYYTLTSYFSKLIHIILLCFYALEIRDKGYFNVETKCWITQSWSLKFCLSTFYRALYKSKIRLVWMKIGCKKTFVVGGS
jgi:hypothetical protein